MIRLGAADPPEASRKFRGVWHRIDQPDIQRTGTLELSTGVPPSLSLDNTLIRDSGDMSHVTLLGRTGDAVDLTIARAQYRSQNRPWIRRIHAELDDKPPVISEHWEGWAVAVGAWLPKAHETLVSQITFRSAMLREWAKTITPKIKWSPEPDTIGGTITLPAPLVAAIPLGTLRFEWQPLGRMSTAGIDEQLVPQITILLDEPQSVQDTWRSIVVPLLHMLTVFVGAGDNVEALLYHRAGGNAEGYEDGAGTSAYGESLRAGEFEWVTSSWMAKAHSVEVPHEFEHLVQARRVRERFADLIPAWFALHSKYEGALFDYIGLHMWESMTIEESFYRVTRSLEIFHGIHDPSPKIPANEFKEIRTEIKAALEGNQHREFIMSRLSHADQPSLRERLTALLGLCGPRLLNWIPEDPKTWLSKVVKTRDQMTHGGGAGPLDGAALYESFHLLDLAMRTILLRELGISLDDAEEWVLETLAARSILYRI